MTTQFDLNNWIWIQVLAANWRPKMATDWTISAVLVSVVFLWWYWDLTSSVVMETTVSGMDWWSNTSWWNSSSSNSSDHSRSPHLLAEYPDALLQFAVVACILFMLVGVPGNFITILALLRYTKVSSVFSPSMTQQRTKPLLISTNTAKTRSYASVKRSSIQLKTGPIPTWCYYVPNLDIIGNWSWLKDHFPIVP